MCFFLCFYKIILAMNFNSSLSHTFPINYTRNNNFVPWHQEISIYQMLGYPPLSFGYTSLPQISTPVLIHQQNNYYNHSVFFQNELKTNKHPNIAVVQNLISNKTQKTYFKPVLSQQNKIRKPVQIIQLSDNSNSEHNFIPQQQNGFPPNQKIKKQLKVIKRLQLQQFASKQQTGSQKIQKFNIKKKVDEKIKSQKRANIKHREEYKDFDRLSNDHELNKKTKRIKKTNQYILSDYQKYQLQILKYREYNHKQVMLGPLFQANIPKFIKNTKNYQIIKNKKKQLLMMRLEK